MPVKSIPYFPNTIDGEAVLDNITRTRRNPKLAEKLKTDLL